MNLYFTRTGVRLSRLVFALFAAFVASVLIVTVLPSDAFAAESKPKKSAAKGEAGGDSDGDGELDRPDGVAAAITARLSKKRVEDLSKRTETSQTFVNPNGTLTDQQYGSPVRVQDEEGAWEDVNLDLVKQADGSYVPKASPVDVTVNGGSSKEASRVTFDDGRSVAVTWPEVLPEPTVAGGVATYKLSAATDLLVSMTSGGVTTRIRLNQPPAEDDPVFTLGLRSKGVDVDQAGDGSLEFTDGKESLASTSRLIAWDAKVDDAGDPTKVVALDANLEKTGSAGDVTTHDLELTTPEGFLTDPSTVYPVIIDPDVSMTKTRDTWVRNGDTVSHGAENRLIVGKINGSANTDPARAYLKFYNSLLENKKHTILKAELGLWQYYGYTCSDRRMYVRPVNGAWSDAITWANMPPPYSSGHGATNVETNRGTAGCAAGWTTMNLKGMVQEWSDGVIDMQGVRLSVHDEAVSSYERRFCSMNLEAGTTCSTAARTPYLKVTYNSAPNTAAAPVAAESRTWENALYVGAVKPVWSTSAVDAEASTVRYTTEVRTSASATTAVSSCTTGLVASGASASCISGTALSNGAAYVARSRATDSHGLVGAWSAWRAFVVDAAAPTIGTVTCTGYDNNQWYDPRPHETTTCTVPNTGADVEWKLGGASQTPLKTSSGNVSKSINVPTHGYIKLEFRSRSRAGTVSGWTNFVFGTGGPSILLPVEQDRSSSTFPLRAFGPGGALVAQPQWRYAPTTEGDTATGWTDTDKVRRVSDGSKWNLVPTAHGGQSITPELIWDPREESGIEAPALVEVRMKFVYPGSEVQNSPIRRIQVVPHAFGGSFPTKDFGPGTAALFTGEFLLGSTDVEVPGYGESLSLGRSHLSFEAQATGPAGVFGPGWAANLVGPETGIAGFTVIDNTAKDGTFQLVDPDGAAYVYLHSSKSRGAQKVGSYEGVGETALEEDDLVLKAVTGETGISHRLTLTEQEGSKTIFVRTATGVWTVEKVVGSEDNSTTTYTHHSDGTVSWIFAPAPAGVACDTVDQKPGCRAINLVYSGSGVGKRLSEVKLRIWDPKTGADGQPGDTAGMETITVAKYTYNAKGQLAAAWDPRIADGAAALKTEYEYEDGLLPGKTFITKVTEPGLKPWRFEYSGEGAVKRILRAQDAAVGTGDAQWTIDYDLPLASDDDGLPNMSASATTAWGQSAADAPVSGAAVFGPDKIPASAPTAAEYEFADLFYFTQSGRIANSAAYGAGAWQIDSVSYNSDGNAVWNLPAEGRSRALSEGQTVEESSGAADKYATFTVYNSAGTRVEETYGPMRNLLLKDGTPMAGRTVTQTVYDDEADIGLMPGRPTADVPEHGFGLSVEERTSVTDRTSPGASGSLFDTTKIQYRYDPVVTGDGDGWELGAPTRTRVQDGDTWHVALNRFDSEGASIESRTPQGTEILNGAGSDTRSLRSVNYSADGSAALAECRNKPAWVGLTCWSGPSGQPATGHSIPEVHVTGYSVLLEPTRVEERSDGAARVRLTEFRASGQIVSEQVTTSGLDVPDRAVPPAVSTYSVTTGLFTSVSDGTHTETTSYDSWGREVSQTDGAGNTATTEYDQAGRVVKESDGKGTYTYVYDGTDSTGLKERRGLLTAMQVDLPSGTPSNFSGAYDSAGTLTQQKYPGGLMATWTHDVEGSATALDYTFEGDPVVGFSRQFDSAGQARTVSGPVSSQVHQYDGRNRLTKVEDTYSGQCTTRSYTLTGDSNRTSLRTYDPGLGGECQSSALGSEVSLQFDAADRITTNGYTYDKLGRTTTIPADHTVNQGGETVTATYHSNDMVATLAQKLHQGSALVERGQDFTIDASDRVSITRTLTGGVSLEETINHYADDSDSPAWIETKSRPDASAPWDVSWKRYVADLAGGLAVTHDSHGATEVQIANLHGDIVGTAAVGSAELESYSEQTEYGLARDPGGALDQPYRWHGSAQRSSNTVPGLVLMGVRLYNPSTGRFLTIDPVEGGTDNRYVYTANPINQSDLTGEAIPAVFAVIWGVRVCIKFCKRIVKGKKKKKGKKCSSFVEGTLVVLPNGSSKPIEEIRPGDRVLAADPLTGEVRSQTVTDLITSEGRKVLVDVEVDQNADGAGGTVTATDRHPFYVPGRGWVYALELRAGDHTLQDDFAVGQVKSVSRHTRYERVYNFTVANFNTYFVSVDGAPVLVHNAKKDCGKKSVQKGLTNPQAKDLAKFLGYKPTKSPNPKGNTVFVRQKGSKGPKYITADKDSHSGTWKGATTPARLNSKSTRSGTYNWFLGKIGP